MGYPLTLLTLGIITTFVGPETFIEFLDYCSISIRSTIYDSISSTFNVIGSGMSITKGAFSSILDNVAGYFYSESTIIINNLDIDKLAPAVAEHLVNSGVKTPLVYLYRFEPQIHYNYSNT